MSMKMIPHYIGLHMRGYREARVITQRLCLTAY
jgi:hypothetical protein